MSDVEAIPLRDIHLPDPMGWWPPAPGWWILALTTLLLSGLIILLLRRYRSRGQWSRQAASELVTIEQRYQLDDDAVQLIRDLSSLIRRSAMSHSGRDRVAGLSGKAWLVWLDGIMGDTRFQDDCGSLIVETTWQPNPQVSPDQAQAFIALTRDWLRVLPARKADAL